MQVLAFPAILIVWDTAPHFLPYIRVYCTPVYGYLAGVVAVGPYGLAVFFGAKALHYTGFFVGAALLVGAFCVRAHARRTWDEAGRPSR